MKDKILELRKQNKSYNEISQILNISKATISYHCKSMGINDPINGEKNKKFEEQKKLNEYYKTHTIDECMVFFNISRSTVIKYCDPKREILTNDEKKRKIYDRIKSRSQKIKLLSIEYKGGKCEICGYDKCQASFDFHHKDPKEKEFGISKYGTRSFENLKLELDKCMLLCANCHRELHYNLNK